MAVLSDADSLLNFTYADMQVFFGGGGGTPPGGTPPTGATPGGWTPAGADVPPTGPPTVPAIPNTAWTAGQSVTTGDGQKWYWDGSAWQSGTAPTPPKVQTVTVTAGLDGTGNAVVGTPITIEVTLDSGATAALSDLNLINWADRTEQPAASFDHTYSAALPGATIGVQGTDNTFITATTFDVVAAP